MKKLKLNKKLISSLGNKQMNSVLGGGTTDPNNDSLGLCLTQDFDCTGNCATVAYTDCDACGDETVGACGGGTGRDCVGPYKPR